MMNSGPVRDGAAQAASAASDAPLLKLEDFLPHRLNVLSSLVSQALTRVYGRYGIGIPEWRVLVTLGENGVMTGKAVGARRQDVLVQFLIEAVTLSLVGGAIGLLLGYGLGVMTAKLIPNFPPAHVPFWAVFLAIGFSAVVGIFFGIYPAAKASRLDPIEALRYE